MGAVKNFFSGVEGQSHFDACMNAKADYVLTSFLQFWDKGDAARNKVKERKKKHPHVKFMVDSGAHTFIAEWVKFKHWSMRDFENYRDNYIAWLKSNRDYIESAVELDIDFTINSIFGGGPTSTLGSNTVTDWQNKYFRPLTDSTGLEICYVWHTERKMEGWEDMCAKFAYVGLPGYLSSEPDFNKFITVARRYTTKIHGFASTKQSDFRDWPWFSVDSITWKTSEMYGTLIHWDEHAQKLVFEESKSARANYRHHFLKHNLDADGIIADKNYKDVTRYALISMSAMEKFYARKYAVRTFYYELRLPAPASCLKGTSKEAIWEYWKKLRPADLFKPDQHESLEPKVRQFLSALSAVQNRRLDLLAKNEPGRRFLERNFARLMLPQMADESVFQKELASYIMPPNPPALARVEAEHYLATNNPPKLRIESLELSCSDFDVDPFKDVPDSFIPTE